MEFLQDPAFWAAVAFVIFIAGLEASIHAFFIPFFALAAFIAFIPRMTFIAFIVVLSFGAGSFMLCPGVFSRRVIRESPPKDFSKKQSVQQQTTLQAAGHPLEFLLLITLVMSIS